MFNSIAQGRYAVESPGEQLIVHLVRRCCERGFATFDLGIGDARYKSLFAATSNRCSTAFCRCRPEGRLFGSLSARRARQAGHQATAGPVVDGARRAAAARTFLARRLSRLRRHRLGAADQKS